MQFIYQQTISKGFSSKDIGRMEPTGRPVHREDTPISLKYLSTLLIKEISTDSLQNLPTNIYHEVTAHIETLRGSSKEIAAEEQIVKAQIELLFSAVKLLFEARYAKINGSREADFQDTQKSDLGTIDYSSLTREEKFVLDGSLETEKRIEMILSAILTGRPVVLDKISNMLSHKHVPVRFIKSIDRFMGIDMVTYGPYVEEDIALLPSENARALAQNGFAEEIQMLAP
jgi:DNA replication initiation complex subunit (GINS family)